MKKYNKINEVKYWSDYYNKHSNSFGPSLFSRAVMKYITKGDKLIDLGCGNGRDTIFFAKQKIYSRGVDIVIDEINLLNSSYKNNKYLSFCHADFSNLPNNKYEHAYSRFTLHSVNLKTEDLLLTWISKNIRQYFFIEVRSDKDKLFGKDTDHYRRFLNLEKLLTKLINNNFQIIYSKISKDFAPYFNEYGVNYNENNPSVIRVVCKNNN